MKRLSRGFTLIEMAFVVVVIGLILSAVVKIGGATTNSSHDDITNARMAKIQAALHLYVIQYGCLPCPADGSQATSSFTTLSAVKYSTAGLADGGGAYIMGCASGACRTTNATVPWITLGLSEGDITDGWNNRIRYVVADGIPCSGAARLAATNGMIRCGGSSFPAGGVSVVDLNLGTTQTDAAYALVSSGADGVFAYKAVSGTYAGDRWGQSAGGQFENSNNDTTVERGSYNPIASSAHFDDIVRYETAPLMVVLCGVNACGNPA